MVIKLSYFLLLLTAQAFTIDWNPDISNYDTRYDTTVTADNPVRAFISGFNFYESLAHMSACDVDVGYFLDFGVLALGAFDKAWTRKPEFESYKMEYLTSLLYVTDALGQSSYMGRNCFDTLLELRDYMVFYTDQANDFPAFAALMHENLKGVYSDLNTQGWVSYMSFVNQQWTDFTYAVSRMAFQVSMEA